MKTKLKKLTLTLSLCVCALILNACKSSGKEADKPKLQVYEPFTAEVTAGDFNCGIELSKSGEGIWSGKFSAPDTIEGLCISSMGGDTEIEYMGLCYTASSDSLPEHSVMGIITSVLDHADASSDTKANADGKDIVISGELDFGQYELYVTKSGEPLSLKVGGGFEADFS